MYIYIHMLKVPWDPISVGPNQRECVEGSDSSSVIAPLRRRCPDLCREASGDVLWTFCRTRQYQDSLINKAVCVARRSHTGHVLG